MRNFTQGANELAEYYGENHDVDNLLAEIAAYCETHNADATHTIKAHIHEIIARNATLKVFPHFPFFWEAQVGRSRRDWGCDSKAAYYLKQNRAATMMFTPYKEAIRPYDGLVSGWCPVGYDHHCPGYDKVLSVGLRGIIDEAQRGMRTARTDDERGFLAAVVDSLSAVCHLAQRFAVEAARLAESAMMDGNDDARDNLRAIESAARHVPEQPAETFREALSCIFFIRETIGSLESFGVSTFGQIDRMLGAYYEADVRNGVTTRDKAKELIHALLAFTDAKFGLCDTSFGETSTTVVIGGCDADGTPMFNEVTRMVIEACMENRYIGTKIIARISSNHPKEYYELLGSFVASRANILVMPNDDTLIQANLRWNKRLQDARLYIGGGCHEMALAGTEVCTRADNWINVPGVLMRSLFPNGGDIGFDGAADSLTFDALYVKVMKNVRHLHDTITAAKEKYERLWSSCDAAPFYSATMADCIMKAKDVTAGGARYNTVSLSMVGAATFIDSLYAIKTLVFDERRLTLAAFLEILENDYEGHEAFRQSIVRLPRHGQNVTEFDKFAAMVMRDLSRMAGQPNARGGIVTPAFYPHDLFIRLGEATMATPDGRKSGTYLSRGFSPSEFTPVDSVTDIVNSLKQFDLTLYPESFATELTLPAILSANYGSGVIAGLIKTFAQSGGSTLQINVLSHEELIEAKADPASHPNLMVRVCGYSQPFNSLSDERKDEVISRAVRGA